MARIHGGERVQTFQRKRVSGHAIQWVFWKIQKGRGRLGYYLCLTPHTSFYLCANRPLCMSERCTAPKTCQDFSEHFDSSAKCNSVQKNGETSLWNCTNSTSVNAAPSKPETASSFGLWRQHSWELESLSDYLFIYLFLMRLIHKREWSDRLTPHHCWPGANFARLFLSL